jgi:prepilin-type N-terminal cleavage/methylation domain-containing protein
MAHTPRPPLARQGFTFVELVIGMAVLLVALLIFSSAVSGVAKQRTVNRETNLAVAAARNMLETLRSEDFAVVYALYNADPADDPGGAGTAPGNRFVVAGLDDTADGGGFDGEILFPSFEDVALGWQLREDLVRPELGLPRDLSGDSVVDDQDHSGSYFILPVQVRLRWQSPIGVRQYQMTTQLCRYNKV